MSFGITELVVALVGVALLVSIVPATLRWLWNSTMPEVFGIAEITFWQAFRLMAISFLLFGIWAVGG